MSSALAARVSIRWLVNVALLIALAVLAGLVLRRHSSDSKLPDTPNIGLSVRISIAGVDFSKSSETLLLALSQDCQYCTESARFYRRLVQGLGDARDLRIIGLLPDSPSHGQWYLNTLGISITEVKQVNLPSLGVKKAPTLVLVDRNGLVTRVWIGKLAPKTESEVMRAIGMKDTRPTTDWLVDRQQVERRLSEAKKSLSWTSARETNMRDNIFLTPLTFLLMN